MKILLTAFEPFNSKETNTSKDILDKITIEEIIKVVLPVSYQRSISELKKAIDDNKPDIVISLGEANRSKNIEIEKYSVNIIHSYSPDNDGVIKLNEPIIPDYFEIMSTNTDVYDLTLRLRVDNLPVVMSSSAGSYVCNLIMFMGIYFQRIGLLKKTLFIHVPHLEGISNLGDYVKTIEKIISMYKS